MQKNRIASVVVKDDWKVVEEFDFPRLVKLKLPDIKEPTDLYVYTLTRSEPNLYIFFYFFSAKNNINCKLD